MTIQREYERQVELSGWINTNLARPYSLDKKRHLALTCFDLAIEHHAAICTLLSSELYGSMYALLRVQFEAYARGLWLYHVASDDDVSKYECSDSLNMGIASLISMVEDQVGLPGGPLSKLHAKSWRIFCSFTHTGHQALLRRISETSTGSVNYCEEEITSALSVAGTIALLAAAELASLTRDPRLVEAAMAKAKEYAS